MDLAASDPAAYAKLHGRVFIEDHGGLHDLRSTLRAVQGLRDNQAFIQVGRHPMTAEPSADRCSSHAWQVTGGEEGSWEDVGGGVGKEGGEEILQLALCPLTLRSPHSQHGCKALTFTTVREPREYLISLARSHYKYCENQPRQKS